MFNSSMDLQSGECSLRRTVNPLPVTNKQGGWANRFNSYILHHLECLGSLLGRIVGGPLSIVLGMKYATERSRFDSGLGRYKI